MQTIIGFIEGDKIVNTILFNESGDEALKIAQKFLKDGHFGISNENKSVSILPKGFGIGDLYIDGEFVRPERPEDDIENSEVFSAFEPLAAFEGFSQNIAEPSNAHIAQMISELRAELVSAGMIKSNAIK